MLTNEDPQGVSNCYVFKSRLQEYAQKVGLPTPVYETIKEGPSHEPSFRSTVIVNNIRYDSLPGFFNRKAAEQSAAEVALVELAKSSEVNQSINQPVHETGLCKNLLQEYAQKMNYAMPLYLCKKDERPGRSSLYSCTVEIGGIRYIGASARTKKEAEIKAARTALLAIQSNASHSSKKQFGHSKFTVIPCKKRGAESVARADGTSKVPKSKKTRFKRRKPRWKQYGDKKGRNILEYAAHMGANINHEVESHAKINDGSCIQTMESRLLAAEAMKIFDDGKSVDYQNEKSMLAGECSLSLKGSKIFVNGKSTELQSNESCVHTMESRPLAAEAIKNFDDGMLVDYPNEKGRLTGEGFLSVSSSSKSFANGKSTELQSNESCVQTAESRSLSAETMKNFDNGMSVDYLNEMGMLATEGSLYLNSSAIFENRKSTELQSNESCVQTMESGPLAAKAMKKFDDGMSVDYQNEKGALAEENSLSLNGSEIFENGKSIELQINESCVQTMDSGPLAAEAMKNFDDGMPVDYPDEKGTLTGEGSFSLSNSSKSFANEKSKELLSNESCFQTMESRPLATEAMETFGDGMSADYQNEKGSLAGVGSLSLYSNKIFENRKSTELESEESCVQTKESRPLAAEATKNFHDGMSVDYQNEKGTLAGESYYLSLNSGKIFERRKSTELHSNESNLGTHDVQVSVLANGDTREMNMEVNEQQSNGGMVSVPNDCIVEASSNI